MTMNPLLTLLSRFKLAIYIVWLLWLGSCAPAIQNTGSPPPPSPSPTLVPSPTSQPTGVPPSPSRTALPTQAALPEPTEMEFALPVQLQLLGSDEGWAVDTEGRVLRKVGDSREWQDVSPPFQITEPTNQVVFFLDRETAWATNTQTESNDDPTTFHDFWRTVDGGAEWEQIASLEQAFPHRPVQLFFVDNNHGWFLIQEYPGMHHVYTYLFRTEDGGHSWELISDPQDYINENRGLPGSYSLPYGRKIITFLDPQRGFASNGELFATVDGGQNWKQVDLPQPEGLADLSEPYPFLSPPLFYSEKVGVLQYNLYEFNQVYCPPCDLFDGLPAHLDFYITPDGGQTWRSLLAPALSGSLDFSIPDQLWFLGVSEAGDPMQLYSYVVGAENWEMVTEETPLPLGAAIDFIDGDIGFAWNPYAGAGMNPFNSIDPQATGEAFLYKTSDGGQTWQSTGLETEP